MEETQNARYLTVPFLHKLPNNEHISHECYYRVIESALMDIFNYGSYQPTILARVIESVMDEMDGTTESEKYTSAFDEVYGDLYSFLEDFLMSPENFDSLSTLTTLSGMGEVYMVQRSPIGSSIILLVNHPIPQPIQK